MRIALVAGLVIMVSVWTASALVLASTAEREPNNSIAEAQTIAFPDEITGILAEDTWYDYFKLVVLPPGLETLQATLTLQGQGNLYLKVYDEREEELTSVDFFPEGGAEYLTTLNLPAGTYYLVVGEESWDQTTTSYTLKLEPCAAATQEEVTKALTKALDFLAQQQLENGSFPDSYGDGAAIPGLVIQAMLGADCLQRNDWPTIYKSIDFLKTLYHDPAEYEPGRNKEQEAGGFFVNQTMYEHAIGLTALLEAYAVGVKDSLEPMLRNGIDFILRAQVTDERPEALEAPVDRSSEYWGGWRYFVESSDADLSVTAWQIIALVSAQKIGFSVPPQRLTYAAEFVRNCYAQSAGGFQYMPGEETRSAGRNAMGALSLQLLGAAKSEPVAAAVRTIMTHAPSWNGELGEGYPFYYWYYGTRATYLEGGVTAQLWQRALCSMLVRHQNPNGSWTPNQLEADRISSSYTTAMGALMLEFCCGSVPFYLRGDKAPQREIPPRPPTARPPQPITVELQAIVVDAENNYVTDLEKEHFHIAEEGEDQKIITFSKEITPISMCVVLDTSGSMKNAVSAVHEAAGQFIAQIRKEDRVLVLSFANEVVTVQAFSSDLDTLRTAINSCGAKGGTALYDAVVAAVESLRGEKGRKAIILLTDGKDENDPGTGPGSKATFDDALHKAKESGIVIYSLGLGKNIETSVLESLARETGGRAYFPPTVEDLAEVYALVAKELRSQYSLSYTSTNLQRNGEWRAVAVTVPDTDYTVRTKAGYYAPQAE